MSVDGLQDLSRPRGRAGLAEDSDEKVVSIDCWILEVPLPAEHRDSLDATMEFVGVTLTTSSGLTGIGYTWTENWGGGSSIKAMVDDVFAPRVVGRTVSQYVGIWQELWWITRRLGRGIPQMALATIDIALWDVRAKGRGVSVAKLLGQVTDRVPTYSSGRFSPTLSVDELVYAATDSVEQGFPAVKMRIGLNPQDDLTRIKAVRKAIGPNVRLMVDANETLDLATAQWIGQRLPDHDIYWFEEPIASEYVSGHRLLSEKLATPIAVGEHLFSLWDFTQFVESKAATILQPDVCMVGGITEFMRVSDLAMAHGLPLAAHYIPEIHIQLAAAIPHNLYVESFPGVGEMLVDPLVVEDGHVLVPDRPGLGIEFHSWVWDRYRVA